MKQQQTVRVVLFFVMFITLINAAHAIGVTPARIVEPFGPNLEQEFSFNVVNNDHKDFDAILYPQGELASYVLLEKSTVHLSAADNEITVHYRVAVPYELRKPGDNIINIVVEEATSGYDQQVTVSSKLSVVHQLILKSPYAGTYASLKFTTNNPEITDDLAFSFAIMNEGAEKIDEFKANVELIDVDGNSVVRRDYVFGALSPGDQRKDVRVLDQKLVPGRYHAIARLYYGEKMVIKETDLVIGGPRITIDGIASPNFQLGKINDIQISLFNDWPEKIEGVYAEVIIRDGANKVYGVFKTATANVQPFAGTTIFGFWDTKDVRTGIYTALVRVNYLGKTTEREVKFEVLPDELRTSLLSGAVVARKPGSSGSIVSILIIAFVILMIMNVLLMLYIKKNKGQPPQLPPPVQMMVLFFMIIINFAFTQKRGRRKR